MSERVLNRKDAPFADKVWEKIDQAVVGAAKSQLSARRLLQIEGPYGLGIKSIPGADKPVEAKGLVEGATLASSAETPLVVVQSSFKLAARDVVAFEQTGLPFDLGVVARAAIACARQEDALLYNGVKSLGLDGLLGLKGALSSKLKNWKEVGSAVEDVIQAVTRLDDAGFHGPYALALAPALYNLLYRRYPQGYGTELEHLKVIASEGVVKAQGINAGGVLLASGPQYATIVLGQDLMAGYVGPEDGNLLFTVLETIALRCVEPAAICVLG